MKSSLKKEDMKLHTSKISQSLIICPPPPPRFSYSEWRLKQRVQSRCALDQSQLAERVTVENDRLIQKVDEETKEIKEDSTHYINERIKDIEFRKHESELQRKMATEEVEKLLLYKERIFDALNAIGREALGVVKKCLILREGRVGIDLTVDDVEMEMKKECEIINAAKAVFQRLLEEINETIRKVRSTIYFIDRDLESKHNAIMIDKRNASLDEHSLQLSMYHGDKKLDYTMLTQEEWESIVTKNFYSTSQAINSGASLRSYADIILNQLIEDLRQQYNIVNEAFRRRIEETKEAKAKLENLHYETTRQINELYMNITKIEKSIAEKESYMALAHTRLGNRAQRDGFELCQDLAQTKLVTEVSKNIENVGVLQSCLLEAQATMRYLMKSQIQIEEDINVKTNTLKIDEVDCMTLRLAMDYHSY